MFRAWHITLLGVVVFWSGQSLAVDATSSINLDLPSPERKFFGDYWLGSAAQSFSEGKDEGVGTGFKAGSSLRYQLAPWARFQVSGELRLYNSRIQARYDDDIMNSGLRLKEGYFALGQDDGFEGRVGGLSQGDLAADLLISRKRAFPGLRQSYSVGNSQMRFTAWAQQAVPTSYSLNNRRADREPMPTFLTESIGFKITPASTVEAEVVATHFRFNHLPAVVAFESSSMGNTVQGEVAPNSQFKYEFEGFAIGSQICWCISGPIQFRTGGQWLMNTKAPENANKGQLLFLSGEMQLPEEIRLETRLSTYFNESDTSPAYYNNWTMGNSNRKGLIAEVELEFKNHGFNIGIEYVQATTINNDPFQYDKQVFTLSVETHHVPF